MREIDPQWMKVNGRLASDRSKFEERNIGSSPNPIPDLARFRRLSAQKNSALTRGIETARPSEISPKQTISIGARIEHQRFGLGRVVSVEGSGENEKATVEFDTVFVVGVEENLFPSPRACEFPRELEEERRLFYVAITRAEKRCLLSCAKSR